METARNNLTNQRLSFSNLRFEKPNLILMMQPNYYESKFTSKNKNIHFYFSFTQIKHNLAHRTLCPIVQEIV